MATTKTIETLTRIQEEKATVKCLITGITLIEENPNKTYGYMWRGDLFSLGDCYIINCNPTSHSQWTGLTVGELETGKTITLDIDSSGNSYFQRNGVFTCLKTSVTFNQVAKDYIASAPKW